MDWPKTKYVTKPKFLLIRLFDSLVTRHAPMDVEPNKRTIRPLHPATSAAKFGGRAPRPPAHALVMRP